MKNYEKQEDAIAIVIIASFDPSIFHPQWFIRHDLVAEEDLSAPVLELNVVHRQVAQFKSSWFSLEVLENRLTLNTSDMSRAEDLRDLACNIFNILTEINITAIGLNKTSIYKCMTAKAWHNLGYVLAPREIWLRAFPKANHEMGAVGMRKLDFQIERWDGLPGQYMVSVYPSNMPPNPEVTFTFNDHIKFDKLIEARPSEIFSNFIISYWDDFNSISSEGISNFLKEIKND